MGPLLLVSLLALALVHWRLASGDAAKLWGCLAAAVESRKELQAAEEMRKLRLRNLKLFSCCLCHYIFVMCCLHLYMLASDPSWRNSSLLALCILVYVTFLVLSRDGFDLSAGCLKCIACLVHMIPCMGILSTALAGNEMCEILKGLTGGRFVMVLLFLDPWVSIPFQFVYSGMDLFVTLQLLGREPVDEVVSAQLFILAETIFSALFVDFALRSRIYAQLDTAAAESLVQGFRRMLRGICDGEVLLDQNLQVAQESEGLQHLIMTKVSLKGRDFQGLTMEPERFRDFLKSETTSVPVGARISLRGSANIRVPVDMFHVPVRLGPEAYHLIAFMEDPESQQRLPDAEEDAVPALLRHEMPPKSSRGSSQASSNCDCAELKEMTLLVDVGSALQDIQEAHLKFERQVDDGLEALESTMPSLRKMLKPQHWESFSKTVVKFAEKSRHDPKAQVVKQLPLHLPGRFRATAQEAFLRPFDGGPGKIWLQLKQINSRSASPPSVKMPGLRQRLQAFHLEARRQVTPPTSQYSA